MTAKDIKATGFNHWILGPAAVAEPITMPTHLPYTFSEPDKNGRVPFPDVVLASGYRWATDPQNGHPFHTNRGRADERLTPDEAVARCMLRPYVYAAFGGQHFVAQTLGNPNEGVVNSKRWQHSTTKFLLQESGIEVNWVSAAPTIRAGRDLDSGKPMPELWRMEDIDVWHDGRADPLPYEEQTMEAIARAFVVLDNTRWARRLFLVSE